MKNKNFLSSIKCALRGFKAAYKSEKNFKIYLLHIVVTLPINIVLRFSLIEMIIYAVILVGVFSAECFNTVAEKICDFLTTEKNEKIKVIKDIAAAGVMFWGFSFYIYEAGMVVLHVVSLCNR